MTPRTQPERPRWPMLLGLATLLACAAIEPALARGTRLLRQPTLGAEHIAFAYGGDLWVVDREGGAARRLTSTPAVESDPHFSPDGRALAFTSNRAGKPSVYVVPLTGGTPKRLSWYPEDSFARGWTPDGRRVLYASARQTAPVAHHRLWTVSMEGGPSERLPAPWGYGGAYAPNGRRIVVEPVSRWDTEWRRYRGGQNTPLRILDLASLEETALPNERTTDVQPVWMGDRIYFLSDRDRVMDIWSFTPDTGELAQLTDFKDSDVKWLDGRDGTLVFERDGYLHLLDVDGGRPRRLEIDVRGDFPWAEPRWEDVSSEISSASLSPKGQRALFEARGEIFTVPGDKGEIRNLSRSAGAADRAPFWSPDGTRVAWFSDSGGGYILMIGAQDGLSEPRPITIGESKMAWEPSWSPDGSRIAFVDDDLRVRIVEVESGRISTADHGGVNIERGAMGPTWSPDSRWLAYAKTSANQLRRIVVWSTVSGRPVALTDAMADAHAPAWDRGGKHLYFLASTDVALGSGWANTSAVEADPTYGVYLVVLAADEPTPFGPQSDEEGDTKEDADGDDDDAEGDERKKEQAAAGAEDAKQAAKQEPNEPEPVEVRIDFEGIERRIVAVPMATGRHDQTLAGAAGTLFVAEKMPGGGGRGGPPRVLHKFVVEEREAKEFVQGVRDVAISADGAKLLYRSGDAWFLIGSEAPPKPGDGELATTLSMRLDPPAEWRQIFEEAWRYERDFFYDPDTHGREWNAVLRRYAPLVPYVRHRDDLNYLLDQVGGELSVGHSFVFGGDLPEVEPSRVGLLGADLVTERGGWKIARIYTFESWNPEMQAPLDRPGLRVEQGQFLVGVEGRELTADEDPYRLLDGTADRLTVLHLNERPKMEGAWTVTVTPLPSELMLRQRAWVEDNRRRVDELSQGKLAYVWVPNTGEPGVISFNRYFFAQQDKLGAVIDERYNQGGLLDDYMVDLMTRTLRAAITNEVPDGRPFRLPAGILGPKLLLINERVRLLGYDNYAQWRLENRMAKTPERALELMEAVWPAALGRVEEEVADMQAVADREGAAIEIEPWDYRYYAEKVRKAKYDLDSDEIKQYLQLDKLREAMFFVAGKLFGFEFRPVPAGSVPVFHEDVKVWEVVDRSSAEHVGVWYLDPYARPGKRSGAWATSYRTHETFDGKRTVLSANNSNFIESAAGQPVLISWQDAETLFHEFGHALHSLSSNVAYPTLNGGVRDYTEFQSQLLERWLLTDAVIENYLVHHETGEPIPADLVAKIKKAATFNQGFETTEYLASALLDMRYHMVDPTDLDADAFERRTLEGLGLPEQIVARHRSPHFGHIFSSEGYSAGYYGYLWADVLTSDAAEAFEQAPGGYYDPELADRLVAHLFAARNAVDPAEAYRAFRGRDAQIDALMRDRGFR